MRIFPLPLQFFVPQTLSERKIRLSPMNELALTSTPEPELNEAVSDAKMLAREQVAAAWQIHSDRVREQLESGWREVLDRIFEQRFAEVESRLREGFERALASRQGARQNLTELLNGAVRQLQQAESAEAWTSTLIQTASSFCGTAGLFAVLGNKLRFQAAAGVTPPADPAQTEVSLQTAPAFAGAVESGDTVVTTGTPEQVSDLVVSLLAGGKGSKIYLFPLMSRKRAIAVLYAEPGEHGIDVSALELLASIAAGTWNEPSASGKPQLVRLGGGETRPTSPSWTELPKTEQELHLRAQRFARTKAAELLLHQVQQVRDGRTSKNLYGALKPEIDAARETFQQQFMAGYPSMVDYLHLELVRTVAKDESDALGVSYPGPLF